MNATSAAHSNGRGSGGRFVAGNRFGKGNPHAQKVGKLRSAVLKCATPRKVTAVLDTIWKQATSGDMTAARLYLEYAVGKSEKIHGEAGDETLATKPLDWNPNLRYEPGDDALLPQIAELLGLSLGVSSPHASARGSLTVSAKVVDESTARMMAAGGPTSQQQEDARAWMAMIAEYQGKLEEPPPASVNSQTPKQLPLEDH